MNEGKIELSIVIPSYNDNHRLPKTLDAYLAFFDRKKLNYEIIVADLSSDGTKAIVKGYQKRHKDIILLNITQRGKGLAVLEAFKIARGRYMGFTDADNATGPEEFYKLYGYLDRYDAVIGSRGLARSHVVHYHQSFVRKFGSYILGVFFVHFLYRLKVEDTQCGAKIFHREKILRVIPRMRIMNSIFDVELLWRFSKIGTIKEVPINWVDDHFSHFKWSETISEFFWLVRVRFGI
jgi:dolichyl-phosphate beta-glucosyltransferase